MKQLIKSATIFNAELPRAEALEGHLAEMAFAEPLSTEAQSIGFVAREDFGNLVETFTGGLAFTVRLDQKILPSSVVKAEVAKIVKRHERNWGRKLLKKEKADIKREVTETLLTQALVRTTLITCYYHHTGKNYLIVPSTSKSLTDRIVSLLVRAVGSVKTSAIHVSDVKGGLTTRLIQWLDDDEDAFAGLSPVNEVQLEQDSRKVTVRMSDLEGAKSALNEALNGGFTVKSLGLHFEGGLSIGRFLSLKLMDNFQMRGIEGPAMIDEDAMFSAQVALEVADIADAVTFLCDMFGYMEGEAAE